jgi:L-rhamnose mutarotase
MSNTRTRRFGQVIRLRREKVAEYRTLHAAVWPAVLARIARSNLRNYTIFLREIAGEPHLFAYFEYVGDDWERDCAALAADEATQRWWKLTEPCQAPLEDRAPGEWWANMEEVFHAD